MKMKERGLRKDVVSRTLSKPRWTFYDVESGARVSVAGVSDLGEDINLVVIHRFTGGSIHVVTSYPVKDIFNEIRRKVKAGRWVESTLEGWP